ncbi:hypothetical protein CRG98_026400, partial [Punica granatum]
MTPPMGLPVNRVNLETEPNKNSVRIYAQPNLGPAQTTPSPAQPSHSPIGFDFFSFCCFWLTRAPLRCLSHRLRPPPRVNLQSNSRYGGSTPPCIVSLPPSFRPGARASGTRHRHRRPSITSNQ